MARRHTQKYRKVKRVEEKHKKTFVKRLRLGGSAIYIAVGFLFVFIAFLLQSSQPVQSRTITSQSSTAQVTLPTGKIEPVTMASVVEPSSQSAQNGTTKTTSYYYFNGQRVAMRVNGGPVTYLFGDQLGSASVAIDSATNSVTQQRYRPFGEEYGVNGSQPPVNGMPTDFTFTGQRRENQNTVGSLMDYGGRFYSPNIGRFISADTVVAHAGNPQSLNRYGYVLNNPLSFVDPSGHVQTDPGGSPTIKTLQDAYNSDLFKWCETSGCWFRAQEEFLRQHPDFDIAGTEDIRPEEKISWAISKLDLENRSGKSLTSMDLLEAFSVVAVGGSASGDGTDLKGGNLSNLSQYGVSGFRSNVVASARTKLGLPPRSKVSDPTVAVLLADGREIWGVSAHGTNVSFSVNSISKSHAEIDALNQLAQQRSKLGVKGGNAVMHVDNIPCTACNQNGGIRSLVEAAGLDSLTVYHPGGSFVVYPR